MKLSICLLLAVTAAASADQGFYQQQPAVQSSALTGPNYYSPDYYDYAPQSEGWLESLMGTTRRSGLGGLFALFADLNVAKVIGMIIVAVFLIGSAIYISVLYTSSGRGLIDDAWEVDHSVWMDQLQKDFEKSWVEES